MPLVVVGYRQVHTVILADTKRSECISGFLNISLPLAFETKQNEMMTVTC